MRIRKVLVANRGEIARRVMRTCREMGLRTVAVFSEPDLNAPFVLEADEAVALGGATAAESYLRGEAIVEAARRTGADAVHPGYGFLSESAAFARLCAGAGLVFIGPPAEAIEAMGSKIAARERMSAAGVPVLPGRAVDVDTSLHVLELGFPLLVKASAGGGGRGMRVVRSFAELGEALAAAGREATAAFGEGTLLLERYLEQARHVEVQVFGDTHGQVVSLFERECSIQRRYQKVVEECPSPAVDEPLRQALGAAAVAAARAVGYVGAGTVEFLLGPDSTFYFLEMNTRLQVEHPVTECVTGLDLVRLQILVAEGARLPEEALRPRHLGHAIEARLYAEDPEQGFLPTTGTVHRLWIEPSEGIRVDSAVTDGSVVGVHYDSLLAKVIAHAPTRTEAADRLAAALSRMQLHGLVTNRDLLVRVLSQPAFVAGAIDTDFLARHDLTAPLLGDEAERIHAVVAALAGAAARRAEAPVLRFAPSGWRNNPSQLQEASFEGRSGRIDVGYRWVRERVLLSLNGEERSDITAMRCLPDEIDLVADGIRRRFDVHRVGETVYIDSALGHSVLRSIPRFPSVQSSTTPGTLLSPMPGVVVRLGAQVGEAVEAGAVVAILEAMKMEHPVTAPRAGRVAELRVREGQTVEAGVVLAVIESAS
jgi:acyl-CoA carboxylase subunit alpha